MAKRILIVEDDAAIREGLCELFIGEGYEVALAEHGQKGLEVLETFRPGLVLLDLMMPVMDGKTFLQELSRHSQHASIPIVLITAAGEKGASGLKVSEVITKPVDIEKLLEVAQKYSAAS